MERVAVGTAPGRAGRGTDADIAQVRVWAAGNGYRVTARGPVPRHVVDAYEAAHPGAGKVEEEEAPDHIGSGVDGWGKKG